MKDAVTKLDAALEALDEKSSRLAARLSKFAALGSLPALTALVTLDVAMRYLFDAPLRWARDVNGLLLLVTIFSALPHAWDLGYHIRMEIVYRKLRGRLRLLADAGAATAGIVFFAAMGIQAFRFAPYMARTGETGEDLLVPVWPFMAYLGFCALLLTVRLLANPQMRRPPGVDSEPL